MVVGLKAGVGLLQSGNDQPADKRFSSGAKSMNSSLIGCPDKTTCVCFGSAPCGPGCRIVAAVVSFRVRFSRKDGSAVGGGIISPAAESALLWDSPGSTLLMRSSASASMADGVCRETPSAEEKSKGVLLA